MKMNKLLTAVLVSSGVLYAQAPPPGEWPPPKIIELKHAAAERIRSSSVLAPFVQSVNLDPSGRYLVITAMTAQKLTAAEELIKRLDVPLKNVELTFHLVAGGAATAAGTNQIPAGLESVVKQLRSTFSFPSYRVLDTAIIRTRDGSDGEVGGTIPGFGSYIIRFKPIRLSEGTPWQVRLDELMLRQRIVTGVVEKQIQTDDAFIKADVDVKDGQRVVVGKSTLRDAALFLVVSARVMD
jgi:hypothetical protein